MLLYIGLRAYAYAVGWTRAEPEEWIAYAGLNAIGAGVILHVAIGHRWPFVAPRRKCSQDMNDLPDPVAAALDAANANDTAGFLACFAPDGVVDDWGREFRGPDEIREWSDREFIGVHVSLDVTAVERAGRATTVTATVGGEGFNGPSHFTFDVAGDRVARMTIRA